ALDRRPARDSTADPQIVIVTPTTDDALALSQAVVTNDPDGGSPPPLVPLTAEPRAQRLLAQRPRAVVGPLSVLASLVAQAQLKLSSAHTLGLLWIDDLVQPENRAALEALLAEVPKETHRVAIASRLDPALEEFLDRAMWRARRVMHVPPQPETPAATVDVRYVLTAPEHRATALGAVLDALDPPSCAVVVSSEQEERAAHLAARALGHTSDSGTLRVTRELPVADVELLVFFSEPRGPEDLRSAASTVRRVVALIPAAGLGRLRAVAGAGARPLFESDAFATARSAEETLRGELRRALQSGAAGSHVLSLEPLMAEYDAAEVAAAAVALLRLEREKGRRKAVAARPSDEVSPRRADAEAPAAGRMTRVYLSVGERDGVRRGDLVGAIAGEAGISGAQIGRIELRDSHALVEVAADVAARVIERLNGASIRGRRVVAREDREREDRKGESRGARTGRGARGPARSAPGKRSGPRAVREASEWSERAERLRRARRGSRDPKRGRDAGED
ncbi:MAG TPA: DbpA RNA binding domain-containing protein, partial [Gemmatimonadaceae bacterium]|nr:DbpA RNA binding domain-containing protein [Gemmatimonadaceae bacterium]